jgi:acetyl-CoA synthetase
MYAESVADPEKFWGEHGKRIDWIRPYTKVKDVSFDRHHLHIRWFHDGTLNASANCLDRHLAKRGDQTAIIWEGDDPAESKHISYRELYEQVCRFANGLKSLGIGKGDMVTIYMPMIPEAAVAMLACARIGAPHSVVFGGFSPESVAGPRRGLRLQADHHRRRRPARRAQGGAEGQRRPRARPAQARKRAERRGVQAHRRQHRLAGGPRRLVRGAGRGPAAECPPEEMDAEDTLFILYTSGSTGKPKGVLHTTGGYMVFASMTHQYVFDYHEGDIYWCTADVGWVTGHSYIVYGPLANGATTLMFEGVPNYPDSSRFWQVVDKHKVNIFYTAPTAIRALMREGEEPVQEDQPQASLRLLGTVGEPINPEAWEWYYRVVGDSRCPIVDTWWQTETGGILITPLPGAIDAQARLGDAAVLRRAAGDRRRRGQHARGAGGGQPGAARQLAGQMRTVYGDHERFVQTYFSDLRGPLLHR